MNPVEEFLLYKAARETDVKAHVRRKGGKISIVGKHDRTVAEKEDAVAAAREAALRARQAKELTLWHTWKSGGQKPKDLKPLLTSFAPMIRSKSSIYTGKIRIPPSAIELTFKKEFVNGLRSYDPSKGSLGTYIYRYLDKAKRWIVENQNTGRIPENRVYKISLYHKVIDELSEELGDRPTNKQIASRLKWSLAEVGRMEMEDRTDLVSQVFEEDPNAITPSKTMEVLKLFKYELSGDQRDVYEHLMGFGRPQITSTGDIAKALNLKDYQVSRLKLQIKAKMERHLKE